MPPTRTTAPHHPAMRFETADNIESLPQGCTVCGHHADQSALVGGLEQSRAVRGLLLLFA